MEPDAKNRIGFHPGIIIGACLLYAVSAGLRGVYGIMLGQISEATGISYASVSFAIAVGQLAFGLAQPAFGVIALKKSNSFVLAIGCILMAIGIAMIPFCTAEWMLMLFLGILLPVGTGAVSFGIIMSAVTPKLGEKWAATASGFINASSGVGSIVFSPLIQSLFSSVGLQATMLALGFLAVGMLPVALFVSSTKDRKHTADDGRKTTSVGLLLKGAIRNRSYLFLMIGFFTCGFHMAIIETHLYSQIQSYGLTDSLAALAFSIYGFASVSGSLMSGFLSSRFPMKYVVGSLYGSRAVMVVAFFLAPKTVTVIFAFVILLGLTGAATVVPTAGLVGKLFGSANLGTLFGVVFLCHQFGSFFSAWLGGVSVEATGTYLLIWSVSAVLSLCAMIVSCCIAEPKRRAGYI